MLAATMVRFQMIITNVSRLGDFLLTLPVASWIHKNQGEKIHYVLSDNFPIYKKVEPLLRLQPFVENVSYVNVGTNAFDPTHWCFDPKQFGIEGNYLNMGFWEYPGKYLPQFYAEHYGLGVDNEFVLSLGDTTVDKTEPYSVWIEASPYREEYGKLKSIVPEDCIELTSDFISDALYAKNADCVYSTMGGFMIILDLMNVRCKVYAPMNLLETKYLYYRNDHEYFCV